MARLEVAREGMDAAIREGHLPNRLDSRRGKENQPSERTLDGSPVSLGLRYPEVGEAGVQVAEVELRTIWTQAELWRDDGRSDLSVANSHHQKHPDGSDAALLMKTSGSPSLQSAVFPLCEHRGTPSFGCRQCAYSILRLDFHLIYVKLVSSYAVL
jgi:hypothetical protein